MLSQPVTATDALIAGSDPPRVAGSDPGRPAGSDPGRPADAASMTGGGSTAGRLSAAGSLNGHQEQSPDEDPLWATEQVNRFWRPASSCLASLVLHALLVIILGLLAIAPHGSGKRLSLMASSLDGSKEESLVTDALDSDSAESQLLDEASVNTFEQTSEELTEMIAADQQAQSTTSASATGVAEDSVTALLRQTSASVLGSGEAIGVGDGDVAGALSGRGAGARTRLVQDGGGTPDSEDAVIRGLRWLQAHQRADGSWCFDLEKCACEGRCADSGTEVSTTGATGLALLAFLGRGETHHEGDYQETVQRGLYYLTSQMLMTSQGGDLRGAGNMYSHGIASIALCEAYAMTRDKALEAFAQKAIDFIVTAQNGGGGWRYVPGMPGDTTVTGWQVMALKSGQMGYLRVPFETIVAANRFLDSVQSERGARYSYQPTRLREGQELTTTSVGLLSRMYLGWPKEQPGLRKGVELLTREGPSMLGRSSNMYYNYYATQIMHQYGGEPWELWNSKMRDFLVRTQGQEGHEAGSWYFDGGQAHAGGRLYVTAVAIMTLEVYYRHMPLYAPHAVDR